MAQRDEHKWITRHLLQQYSIKELELKAIDLCVCQQTSDNRKWVKHFTETQVYSSQGITYVYSSRRCLSLVWLTAIYNKCITLQSNNGHSFASSCQASKNARRRENNIYTWTAIDAGLIEQGFWIGTQETMLGKVPNKETDGSLFFLCDGVLVRLMLISYADMPSGLLINEGASCKWNILFFLWSLLKWREYLYLQRVSSVSVYTFRSLGAPFVSLFPLQSSVVADWPFFYSFSMPLYDEKELETFLIQRFLFRQKNYFARSFPNVKTGHL